MTRLRLGVVGVGHLGQAHARIASELPDVELVGVVDVHPDQANTIATRCGTQPYADYRDLLPQVDAAIVAVPTTFHHDVARAFLKQGISLLIEKPITNSLSDADELLALANQHDCTLQVGHIERFNPAFETLQRSPFQPKLIQVERSGPFSGRSTDVGVVLDLMIHDLDLVRSLVGSSVTSVSALGMSVLGGHEDIAQAQVTFANGAVAHFLASRVHHEPVRVMRLWGAEGSAVLDMGRRHLRLTQPTTQLLQAGFDVRRVDAPTLHGMRTGLFDRYLQTLEMDCTGGDQLTAEIQEFVHCVQSGTRPRADGQAGRDALALAEQILGQINAHPWTTNADGPCGPRELPASLGWLFTGQEREAA